MKDEFLINVFAGVVALGMLFVLIDAVFDLEAYLKKKFPKWEPKYKAGDYVTIASKEFEKYIHKKTMECKILERKPNEWKRYYYLESPDFLLDGEPVPFSVHENNILHLHEYHFLETQDNQFEGKTHVYECNCGKYQKRVYGNKDLLKYTLTQLD